MSWHLPGPAGGLHISCNKFKELYNIQCRGQAAQSLNMHSRCCTTWITVQGNCKSFGRSSSESHGMREMLQYCETSRYKFMLTWYLFPTSIMIVSYMVFYQAGKVFWRPLHTYVDIPVLWDSSTFSECEYLVTKVGMRHQELSKLLLIHMQVYKDFQDCIQLRITALKQEVIL